MKKPKKRELTARLALLNDGRVPYLNFVRNLPSAAFLLTMAIIVGFRLDFHRIDWGNLPMTLVLWVLIGSFALFMYANVSTFYKDCFAETWAWIDRLDRAMRRQHLPVRRRLVIKAHRIWHRRLVEFLEMLTVINSLQIALAIVFLQATVSAESIWRLMHH